MIKGVKNMNYENMVKAGKGISDTKLVRWGSTLFSVGDLTKSYRFSR